MDFLEKIKQNIKEIEPNADIYLFGSRVTDKANKESDWDILILTDKIVNNNIKLAIRKKLTDREIEAGTVISTLIHSKENWKKLEITPLHKEISNFGIKL